MLLPLVPALVTIPIQWEKAVGADEAEKDFDALGQDDVRPLFRDERTVTLQFDGALASYIMPDGLNRDAAVVTAGGYEATAT